MLSNTDFNKLIEYINYIDKNSDTLIGKKLSKEERIFAGLLTLNEELGEFSDEIKASLNLSFNKTKVSSFKKENLENEAADVLISLLCLMKSVGIDNLDDVIQRKIKKNNDRGY